MHKEATGKYDKEQCVKSELLEICYSCGHPWPKGAQVAKQGKIPGRTVWSQYPLGDKKNGGA